MNEYNIEDFAAAGHESSFTITLGELIACGYNTAEKLGLSGYPIYDETHRAELNYKIVQHYAQREIAAETPEQFVYYMRRTMAEIMPLYNQRYESAAQQVDYLSSIDYYADSASDSSTESSSQSSGKNSSTQHTASTSTSTSDTDAHSKARTLNSDTPQTQLSGREDYATNISDSASDTSNHTASTQNADSHTDAASTEEYSHNSASGTGKTTGQTHVHGRQQPAAALLQAWRDSIINVDLEIIYALEPCFMQLFDSGDTMTPYAAQCYNIRLGGIQNVDPVL